MVKLKKIFGKCIFHAQPNTRIYEKAFPETIFTQFKRSFNLKDFSIVILLGDTTTSPTPDHLWLDASSTYNFLDKGSCIEIVSTSIPPKFCFSLSFYSEDSVNSATKSARIWPLTEVQGIYLISKASKIVPHLAILPV